MLVVTALNILPIYSDCLNFAFAIMCDAICYPLNAMPWDIFVFHFKTLFLRAAKGLTDAAISVRQSNRALTKLKDDLSQLESLSAVRIYANGSVVEVRDDEKAWEVESGQLTMNFSIQELSANVAELARSAAGGEEKALEDLDSDEWYNLGLDLEEMDPIQAPDAYREAIRLDPFNADAHVNLGRLYQLSGDLKGATRHYQLALATRPGISWPTITSEQFLTNKRIVSARIFL